MSHFDDIEPVFYTNPPKSPLGCLIWLVIAVAAIIWAYTADDNSKKLCEAHGERYVDSRTNYTLCEKKDGSVVRR